MTIRYVIQRALQLLLIVFIAVTINFILPRLIPGDPVEAALATKIAVSGNLSVDVQKVADAYRAKFGLDQPLWKQYLNYWNDLFHLDLGVSLVNFPATVIGQIRAALPWTIGLLTVATLIAFGLGSLIGALLAWPRTPKVFHVLVSPLMLLSTIPFFLLGIILLSIFAVEWRMFPAGGGFSPTLIPGFNLGTALDMGLIGESGCGKTTMALALMSLIRPPGRIPGGRVLYTGPCRETVTASHTSGVKCRRLYRLRYVC